MITMKTGSKTPVKFIRADDVSETVITVFTDDPSDVIAAKLQRVLELEGGYTTVVVNGVRTQPYTEPDARIDWDNPPQPAPNVGTRFTPADRAAYDERLKGAQAMGWGEDIDIDSLPEK